MELRFLEKIQMHVSKTKPSDRHFFYKKPEGKNKHTRIYLWSVRNLLRVNNKDATEKCAIH